MYVKINYNINVPCYLLYYDRIIILSRCWSNVWLIDCDMKREFKEIIIIIIIIIIITFYLVKVN